LRRATLLRLRYDSAYVLYHLMFISDATSLNHELTFIPRHLAVMA
jgi:hypothetical protein